MYKSDHMGTSSRLAIFALHFLERLFGSTSITLTTNHALDGRRRSSPKNITRGTRKGKLPLNDANRLKCVSKDVVVANATRR